MNPTNSNPLPEGYETFVEELKDRIRSVQVRAALSVNWELVVLYWRIGRDIVNRQKQESWGARVIDRLSLDLDKAFPAMRGFSRSKFEVHAGVRRSLSEEEFVQQVVAQLPWGHQVRILDAVKDSSQREWYVRQAFENGWSRNVL